MENIILKGRVTATSNKVDEKYKKENPTKTAYVTISEADRQKAIDFGLSEYNSKQDGNSFFIVKLPKDVAIYVEGTGKIVPEKMSGKVDTPNFMTAENKEVKMNFIKGEKSGNDFYRLQAIQITESTDIISVLPDNPFA